MLKMYRFINFVRVTCLIKDGIVGFYLIRYILHSLLSCREYLYCRMYQTQSKAFFSKEAVESMASRKRICLGSEIYTKIQLSILVGCFSDIEWGRRDSKVQLLNFPPNVVSLLWPVAWHCIKN